VGNKDKIMKRVLIMVVSDRDVEQEALDSWNNQDYQNYSILLHILKPIKLHEDKDKNKNLNIAVNTEIIRKMALTSNADYFFFVDSDIVLPSNAISELTKQLEVMKVHAIAGYYLLRGSETYCIGRLVENNTILYMTTPEKSVIKIDYAGTGCMMVSRELLEKITIKVDFNTMLKIAGTTNVYTWLDHCWDLCNQLFALDYQLYVDGDVICKHLAVE
jgi:cellulose synthase/poly-beta-1,6-N-acetylglucosamine synthase-like glycosyltransferase